MNLEELKKMMSSLSDEELLNVIGESRTNRSTSSSRNKEKKGTDKINKILDSLGTDILSQFLEELKGDDDE